MNKLSPFVLGLSLAVAGSSVAAAQQDSPSTPVPKVLQITREFVKPGKAGAVHDRSESAFVQAMARAKSPTHYIALSSLSGKSRALYLTGYSSFEAWEQDNKSVEKNAVLSAELERASVADGELLDSLDQMVYSLDDELSYRPVGDLSHARYIEASVYQVRPGHGKEWSDLVKMAIAANQKAGTSAHWAMFHLEYGGDGGTYVLLSSDKSMADIDTSFTEEKQFHDAMGEEGMKKFRDLYGSAVSVSNQQLFAINPRQSYVSEDWIKADPEFWKPKPLAAPAAKAAAKPAMEEKKAKP
jgi:hypothetical protein